MNKKERLEFLKNLSELDGISGNEIEVAQFIAKHGQSFSTSVEYDNLGSVLCYKKGQDGEPVVMVTGHIDEVGFLINKIEDCGLLRIHPIGGWWNHVILAEVMRVKTRTGKKYFGVIGAQPPHGMPPEARAKVLENKDLYLDLGVTDKKMIEELGVRIGDTVTPYTNFRVLNDGKTLLGKAWDDRIGVAVALEVLENLQGDDHKATFVAAGTVQEEVGLRGAKTASYFVKPDIAFAIDVTMSNDLPSTAGAPKIIPYVEGSVTNQTRLGNGVALSIMDGSVIAHRGLFDFVEAIAKEKNIKYTYDLLTAGGTDSGEMHKQYEGVITMTISLPCRYFHSHVSLIHIDDYLAAIDLMTEVIKKIDKKVLQDLKESKYR